MRSAAQITLELRAPPRAETSWLRDLRRVRAEVLYDGGRRPFLLRRDGCFDDRDFSSFPIVARSGGNIVGGGSASMRWRACPFWPWGRWRCYWFTGGRTSQLRRPEHAMGPDLPIMASPKPTELPVTIHVRVISFSILYGPEVGAWAWRCRREAMKEDGASPLRYRPKITRVSR